jgi:hypothetical protein
MLVKVARLEVSTNIIEKTKRYTAVLAPDCRDADFVLFSVMA